MTNSTMSVSAVGSSRADRVSDQSGDVARGGQAVVYLRVSSVGQVKTAFDSEGNSIPAQRVACLRKAEQLGLTVVDEYVEPGRSATEMTRRVAFQSMLGRIRERGDVDYLIVHKLSRMARNRYDDAIVMASLRARGVRVVSATESVDDTPVGQLMHGILAAFNEYQSRESGADISYKMGHKAQNGGSLGLAPLGYLNVIERTSDGRQIRTVIIDPDRAEFVRLAFELYATGRWAVAEIADELTSRGLRTRPTPKRPARPITPVLLSKVLHNPYYTGVVTHNGQTYPGRHSALITTDQFERVQSIHSTRAITGERRRKHHHYLSGTVYCGTCHSQRTEPRRLALQRSVGNGGEYYYFFCPGIQHRTCHSPYHNTARVEYALVALYAAIDVTPAAAVTASGTISRTLNDDRDASRRLTRRLTSELAKLDAQESNLISLATALTDDGPKRARAKILAKLHQIEEQRSHIRAERDTITNDLTTGANHLDDRLRLLENLPERYRHASDDQRRELNHTIFSRVYIHHGHITGYELNEPFASLRALTTSENGPHEEEAAHVGDRPQTPSNPKLVLTMVPIRSRGSEATQPRRGTHRLANDEVGELVTAYQAGSTIYELGDRFGVARQTVSKILKRHGVTMRRQGLTPEHVDEAVRLYEDGWSVARIAERMSVGPWTVLRRLRERKEPCATPTGVNGSRGRCSSR